MRNPAMTNVSVTPNVKCKHNVKISNVHDWETEAEFLFKLYRIKIVKYKENFVGLLLD